MAQPLQPIVNSTDKSRPKAPTPRVSDAVGTAKKRIFLCRLVHPARGKWNGIPLEAARCGSQTVYANGLRRSRSTVRLPIQPPTPSSYTITETSVSDTLSQLPTDPVKNGYTFAGWYTAVSGGGDAFTTSSEVAGNRTVYAKWTALVTYDVSDATTAPNPTTKTIVYSSGNDTVQSLPTEPQKTRYVFTVYSAPRRRNLLHCRYTRHRHARYTQDGLQVLSTVECDTDASPS